MSYTVHNGQPQGIANNESNFLREALIGEIVAINDYSHHIAICPINEISRELTHIMQEEKKHYGMFLELIRKNDDVQMEKYLDVMKNHHRGRKSHKNHRSTYECEKIHMINILNFIRHDIKGELEAIISYEHLLSKSTDKRILTTLTEVIGDEKEHVEELTKILTKYDRDLYGPIEP
ncbi:ferritin-like domain-containing protein [Oceanirhabdus sp. W0125-5]|uniref:ferritin-like domain-containing protein n=1 Tax=Oceanirhabdus sp. W0125-5 TaxID=2999116 RepID=UPI0022F2B484|nr:ferritin-like domain-containing protein [Oceanirhabdus sp. W0125-5]WBW95514.1 ferritin-like domain-containing protein [Oceanirhabdus sp. W0125-5]